MSQQVDLEADLVAATEALSLAQQVGGEEQHGDQGQGEGSTSLTNNAEASNQLPAVECLQKPIFVASN